MLLFFIIYFILFFNIYFYIILFFIIYFYIIFHYIFYIIFHYIFSITLFSRLKHHRNFKLGIKVSTTFNANASNVCNNVLINYKVESAFIDVLFSELYKRSLINNTANGL